MCGRGAQSGGTAAFDRGHDAPLRGGQATAGPWRRASRRGGRCPRLQSAVCAPGCPLCVIGGLWSRQQVEPARVEADLQVAGGGDEVAVAEWDLNGADFNAESNEYAVAVQWFMGSFPPSTLEAPEPVSVARSPSGWSVPPQRRRPPPRNGAPSALPVWAE